MVKVKYSAQLSGLDLEDYYHFPLDRQSSPDKTKHVEYLDTQSNYRLVLDGKDFTYPQNPFNPFDGTVQEMRLLNDTGKTLLTITGANYDGGDMIQAFINGGYDGMIEYALKGNDKLVGSKAADEMYGGGGKDVLTGNGGHDDIQGGAGNDKLNGGAGNDFLFGGTGNDRLTGGKGADLFHFSQGTGKDVITDFKLNQDKLVLHEGEDFTVKSVHNGHDTLLDFGGGDTLTLLHIKKSQFDHVDIDYIM